jgi:hypothetical protein
MQTMVIRPSGLSPITLPDGNVPSGACASECMCCVCMTPPRRETF